MPVDFDPLISIDHLIDVTLYGPHYCIGFPFFLEGLSNAGYVFPFSGGARSAEDDYFVSLRPPDLSRRFGWPSADFANRLANYSQVVG